MLAVLAAGACTIWAIDQANAAVQAGDAVAEPSTGTGSVIRIATGRRTPRNPAPTSEPAASGGATSPATPPVGDPLAPALPTQPDGLSTLPPMSSSLPASIVPEGQERHTLANCMKLWEPATHMSRAEWKSTCQRSLAEAAASKKAAQETTKPAKKSRRDRKH